MPEWQMHAYRFEDRIGVVGARHYVRAHGLRHPIVPVTVRESEEGLFLGWLPTGEDTPRMIQPEKLFEMQFPYGSRAEERAGRGRAVRLDVRASHLEK